jgi:hypothetical protein
MMIEAVTGEHEVEVGALAGIASAIGFVSGIHTVESVRCTDDRWPTSSLSAVAFYSMAGFTAYSLGTSGGLHGIGWSTIDSTSV